VELVQALEDATRRYAASLDVLSTLADVLVDRIEQGD
jgi:hypothetical protein